MNILVDRMPPNHFQCLASTVVVNVVVVVVIVVVILPLVNIINKVTLVDRQSAS